MANPSARAQRLATAEEALQPPPLSPPEPELQTVEVENPDELVEVTNRHVSSVAGVAPLAKGMVTRRVRDRHFWAFR